MQNIENYESSDSDSEISNSESKTLNRFQKRPLSTEIETKNDEMKIDNNNNNVTSIDDHKDNDLVDIVPNKKIKIIHKIETTLNTSKIHTQKKKKKNNNLLFMPRQVQAGISNIVTEEHFKKKK